MLLLVGSVIVLNLIAFYIPKTMNRFEMYVTSLFAVYFACEVDVYLNLRNDFYGYFNVGADYRTLIIFFGLYPAFSLIFLNLYPHSAGFLRKTSYIIVFSVLSTALEWLFSTKYGFFYHNEWKLFYSLLAYPFILLLLHFHLVMIRKLFASNRY